MKIRIIHAAAVAAGLVLLLAPQTGEAKKRETTGLGACWIEGKIVYTQGSTTASCCYDDGCYVCDTSWNNCKWESKAMQIKNSVKNVNPGVLDPGPSTSSPRNPAATRAGTAVKK